MGSTDSVSVTTFGLLRHGQTEWNLAHRIQGSADSPLTAAGKARTEIWAQFLAQQSWHLILSSDQGRAVATARIINSHLKLPLETDLRLREQHWGHWEGLTIDCIKEKHAEELQRQISRGWHFRAPEGESRLEVQARVEDCLRDAHTLWPGKRVLVICHQGVIKCLLYALTGRAFVPGEDPLLQHNSLHFISCSGNSVEVAELNVNLPDCD